MQKLSLDYPLRLRFENTNIVFELLISEIYSTNQFGSSSMILLKANMLMSTRNLAPLFILNVMSQVPPTYFS